MPQPAPHSDRDADRAQQAGAPSLGSAENTGAAGTALRVSLIYGMDCKALKAENMSTEYQPKMAPTDMKETVIPKSGGKETPETTKTTGVNK